MHRLFWCRNSNSSLRNLSFPSTPPIPPRPDRLLTSGHRTWCLICPERSAVLMKGIWGFPVIMVSPKHPKAAVWVSLMKISRSVMESKTMVGYGFLWGPPGINGNIRDAYWTSFWEEELVRLLCLGCNMFAQAGILSLESKCVSSDSLPSQFQSLLWKKQ